MMRALIVANGVLPQMDLIQAAIESSDFVLAADGGANALWAGRLRCDAILGDFDSLAPNVFPGVVRIEAGDQDRTDLDKAVSYVIDNGYSSVVMTGVTGDRLDHTFGALCVLLKYGRKVDLTLFDDSGTARLVIGVLRLQGVAGRTISLLPVTPLSHVSTSGLQWELSDEALAAGVRDGISNVATCDDVSIRAGSGDLVVYVHHA